MVAPITVTGMVLSAMAIGDYDKRLVILTKERGKITAFAKGARRQTSALLACSNPFTFGEFTIYESRTAYNITTANVQNYFVELREDFEAVSYGFYFCEFCDYLSRENVEAVDLLKLLYQSFRALTNPKINRMLIRRVFELKALIFNGEAPEVFECVKCNEKKSNYFHPKTGGLLCDSCKKDRPGGIILSGSTIYTLQFILTSPIEKLYTFILKEEILNEFIQCVDLYVHTYVDRTFKSLEFLDIALGD